jgi:hypothetical protein
MVAQRGQSLRLGDPAPLLLVNENGVSVYLNRQRECLGFTGIE